MQNKIPKNAEGQAGGMAGEDIQPRDGKPGKSKTIVYQYSEKIPVEIKETVRINPKDFAALKHSFEEWASQWD